MLLIHVRRTVLAAASVLAFASPARADKTSTRECIAAATEGQKLRDHGKLVDARAKFLACSNDTCPSDIRTDCGQWLGKVDESTPHVVFGARDERGADLVKVRVTTKGTTLAKELGGREQVLDPGPYDFLFENEAGAKVTVSVVLRAGDPPRTVLATFAAPPKEHEPVTPPPREAPSGSNGRTIALVSLGAGSLLAAGAAVFFALHAHSTYSDLEKTCAPGCTDSDTRSVRTDIVVANVTGIVAIALGVAFGGVAILGRPSASAAVPGQIRF